MFSDNQDTPCTPLPSKKRKIDDKVHHILDYSKIKIPALLFCKYLETYAPTFIEECQR